MKKLLGITVISIGIMLSTFGIEAKYYSLGDFLNIYFNTIVQDIPETYKYINVLYKNIPQTGNLYEGLQKAIYTNIFPNKKISLPIEYSIKQETAAKFIKDNLGINIKHEQGDAYINQKTMISFLKTIKEKLEKLEKINDKGLSEDNLKIIKNIYNTLESQFLYTGNIDKNKMEYGAIQGFVDAANDEYTKFFPPTEAKSFNDELKGEVTGIGVYLEMKEAGVVIVSSVIDGYSAHKSGLKAKDQIIKVNDTIINESMSISDISSLIKGQKGTIVNITIKRSDNELNFELERVVVKIENIKSEKTNNSCIVSIKEFSAGVGIKFQKMMDDFSSQNCEKYIFDLRNNPGGFLDEALLMLDVFIPKNQPELVAISKDKEEIYLAEDLQQGEKILNPKTIILINEGSASASEIFAGTLRDYNANLKIIGQKSFGKGSVQKLIDYKDGSSLKYTIQKRYTGKTRTGIDKIGIIPDIEIIQKEERGEKDIILEVAKKLAR